MSQWFSCPYLGAEVELTDEREGHIREAHELVLAEDSAAVAGTLFEPDQIRRSRKDPNARLFLRWYDELVRGKYCVVVVVEDTSPDQRFGSSRPTQQIIRAEGIWNGREPED